MTLAELRPEIPRDRYGRPLIVPPGGGDPVPYTRCTRFVGALEDTFNLSRWQQRMVAVGLADRPDLLLSVAAHRDDKAKLNALCEDATEAAKGHAAATRGTALHSLTETIDRGGKLPVLPGDVVADIDAYRRATERIEWLAIEQGVVVDDLKVHGTADRVGRLPDGRVVIADLKTGSVEYGIGKIAQQLAVYAHGVPYDHVTGTRGGAWGVDFDRDLHRAVVIHLPAGTGTCSLLEVDIEAGWHAVHLAREVWDWRKAKGLSRPLDLGDPAPAADPIADLIAAAPTYAALLELYEANAHRWQPHHTEAAKARRASLAAPAA